LAHWGYYNLSYDPDAYPSPPSESAIDYVDWSMFRASFSFDSADEFEHEGHDVDTETAPLPLDTEWVDWSMFRPDFSFAPRAAPGESWCRVA
jgi:hypothetical protein